MGIDVSNVESSVIDFANNQIPYLEIDLYGDKYYVVTMLLSGVSCLLIDGFNKAILIDAREYPARNVQEPEKYKVLRGSRDGFVETLILNTALIRRRIRNPEYICKVMRAGKSSRTDIAICYMNDRVDRKLLDRIISNIEKIDVDALTMNQESLSEAVYKGKWFNPFPKFRYTERPDTVAASVLEGQIAILVDNSPAAMLLPTTIFDVIEEADDYYFPPVTGTYLRLARMIVGYTYGKPSEQKPVTAGDLHAEGAMTALLKDALKPNLVQTLEHVPAIVHGGPFANIAHGCNSVTATKMAMKLADYAITEAGFGADLGAEKFLDIKCRMADLHPNAVVIVATVRALKYNGGVAKADLNNENLEALQKGLPNLLKHVNNIKNVYKLPCVVAINAFPTDTKAELDLVEAKCKELGVNVALSEVWAKGGEGGLKLAEEVIRLCEEPNDFTYAYELEGSIEDKLNQIVQKVYGGKNVVLTANAQKQAKQLEALGFGNCPICVAKTQYSLTDDQTKLGAPTDFEVTVRNLKISAGAGFIVALTGEIMTMPGLPKVPAAERIDVDETGKITGLF